MAPRTLLQSRSTASLLERAATFLQTHAHGSEVLVLGPTRAAANELALAACHDGCQGVHTLTLTQLAANLAALPMGRRSLAPISKLGMEALAARIVHTAQRAQRLAYFSPVALTPGFPRAVARTLAELRLNQVGTNDLASAGLPGADLAHLLALYEQELDQRSLADLPILLQLATEEAALGAHRFLRLPLVLLDPSIESRRHEELLAVVARQSPAVLATAIGGENRAVRSLESILETAGEDLDQKPATTLDRVRTWLFSPQQPPPAPPDPELLFSAPGESLECIEIARRIRALAQQGTPFDRVAILLRNVEQYQPLVEEALRRASIPGYFSRGTVRPEPSGRAFLALLACAAEGCSASRFAEYLSLGQVPPLDENGAPQKHAPLWVPPDDEVLANFPAPPPGSSDPAALPAEVEAAVDAPTLSVPIGWEKLLVDAAVIGGHDRWARRLRGLRAEFQAQLRDLDGEDQSHRPHIERRIEQLARLEHFALPVIDALDSLPRSAAWGQWLEALDDLARTALRRPEPVLSVLSELQPMSEVGPVSLDEVYDVLSEKLGLLRAEPPKRRYGHVFVGSIEETRGRNFDVVLVPGLAEGLFPRRALEDPLLVDAHRAQLAARLDTQSDRVARERMLLRSAAASAAKRFVVSYPRMDVAQARPRVPSFYALEVLRAAEGRLPSLREFEKRAAKSAPSRLDWPAPSDPKVAIDAAEYDLASLQASLKLPRDQAKGSARYLMETNQNLARSLRSRGRRWRNRWSEADGVVDPDSATLAVLHAYGFASHSYSPSSLQLFAACPYRFLLHAMFQFRPREASVPLEQMDPLTRGALFHSVQFELFRELSRKKKLPVTPERVAGALDLADQVLDRVSAKFEDKLAPAIPRVWKSEVEDLRTDLRGWIKQVAAAQSGWVPAHFEFAFGLAPDDERDPASTKEEAIILNGIRLRGSIDLVEKHAGRNTLRVVDHKTGKAPENRPQYVGGGAILQPLLYALAAEGLLKQPVESGNLFFCTQRGDFSEIGIPLTQESRDRLARVLETIGRSIEEGFLPAAPQHGACAWCDYRPVCGPYEELRSKRKQADRLEPLIEIRNLP
ncbi:MAG TPA: PD-(D/E)XK nuclease family protein [Bryobacteraceae bacterium]|nr:PD-(D/E)XK nuclease family protein [Bryobacteraceae bacterium]